MKTPDLCFLFKPPSRRIWQEKGTLMETLNFYKMFLLFSALTPGRNFVLWIIFITELVILTCHWNKLILDYYYSQNLAIFLCISPKENQWSPSNNRQDWTWFGPITTLTSFLPTLLTSFQSHWPFYSWNVKFFTWQTSVQIFKFLLEFC